MPTYGYLIPSSHFVQFQINSFSGTDYKKITFSPDLKRFKMQKLDEDIVALMTKRAVEIAATVKGVAVFLNGEELKIKNLQDYVKSYNVEEFAYEQFGERWEGGQHVNHVLKSICNQGYANLKKDQVRERIWVFINCHIENPTFDSEAKENMTLQVKNFGSRCTLSPKFIEDIAVLGIIETILNLLEFETDNEKQTMISQSFKLQDAICAVIKSKKCKLILTEGDSAKAIVLAGIGVIGQKNYGVFPLQGKLLNARVASEELIKKNAEINKLCEIIGLQYGKKYETEEDLKTLRYHKVMLMMDQDHDGSHIKGLVINFIHFFWPELLRLPFLEEFITPWKLR